MNNLLQDLDEFPNDLVLGSMLRMVMLKEFEEFKGDDEEG